jgi:hypothetical protein
MMNSGQSGGQRARPPAPIKEAATKTIQIQQDLAVAEAELHLTNTVLDRELPQAVKQGEVKRAVAHNAAVEEKIGAAAEDLQAVAELLEAEVSERQRLERELERLLPP